MLIASQAEITISIPFSFQSLRCVVGKPSLMTIQNSSHVRDHLITPMRSTVVIQAPRTRIVVPCLIKTWIISAEGRMMFSWIKRLTLDLSWNCQFNGARSLLCPHHHHDLA